MEFISPENLYGELLKELSTAREEVILVSPWVEGNLTFELINSIPQGVNIELLIRAGGVEDLKITPPKVLKLARTKGGKIFLHKSLHAKFILIDRKTAFVGSANLTDRGLNLFNLGNREGVVKTSDKKLLKELLNYYETLKGESLEISPDLVGFLIDKTETGNFTVLLLEEIPEGTFLKVEGKILTLLQRVQKLNTNLLKEQLLNKIPPKGFEEYKTEWGKAFLFALSGESSDITLGELKPLGRVENDVLAPLKIPPLSGAPVFKVYEKELKPLTGRTFYGKPMECPVFAGKAEGIDVYLDLGEIWTRHAAVLGITGSGKSYFTQRVIARSVKTDCGISFVVLDPQGEYADALKELLGKDFEKFVSVRSFENTILPLTVEDFVSLFELLGFSHLLKGNSKESKLFKDFLAKTIVESAKGNVKPLEQILEEAKKEVPSLEDEIETLKGELVFLYGEEVLKNQPSEFQKAVKKPDKRVVIFDFSQVLDTQTRLNSAGLILRNLFFKREKGERTIAVVEEAHNFAPEKGFGDAEAGKRNLALIMLEKIASQGRKLNFGLWIIAQRPAQVNKYILSQTNTHFLFRLTDKNDLQAVETYLSDTSEGLIKKLPLLGIGECMANGLGVPFEVKLKVE